MNPLPHAALASAAPSEVTNEKGVIANPLQSSAGDAGTIPPSFDFQLNISSAFWNVNEILKSDSLAGRTPGRAGLTSGAVSRYISIASLQREFLPLPSMIILLRSRSDA